MAKSILLRLPGGASRKFRLVESVPDEQNGYRSDSISDDLESSSNGSDDDQDHQFHGLDDNKDELEQNNNSDEKELENIAQPEIAHHDAARPPPTSSLATKKRKRNNEGAYIHFTSCVNVLLIVQQSPRPFPSHPLL